MLKPFSSFWNQNLGPTSYGWASSRLVNWRYAPSTLPIIVSHCTCADYECSDNSELSSEARLTPESEEMYGEESSEASKLSRERKKYTEEEEAEAKRSLLMALFWFMLPILVSLVFGVIPRLLGYRL